MDGLDDFEKSLAAEKAERERADKTREERRSRKQRHRDRDRDDNHRHRGRHHDDDEGHRHKRSRHGHSRRDEDGDAEEHRSRRRHGDERHYNTGDAKEQLPLPDEELPPSQDPVDASKPPVRDSWMTAPSALDVERIHRPQEKPQSPPRPEPKRVLHERELNRRLEDDKDHDTAQTSDNNPAERNIDYTIGDAGSSWRMSKLKNVYAAAEQSGRPVDDVAAERFGSLQDFDDAREEKDEVERAKLYGAGYRIKDKPTGELYRERLKREREAKTSAAASTSAAVEPEQGIVIPDEAAPAPAPVDQSALNRLRAQMMKAKLRRAPNAPQLEAEYNLAAASLTTTPSAQPVVLGAMDSRLLAGTRGEVKAVDTTRRGRERGTVVENGDMSVEDMVREERRTKGQAGGEGLRLAERIAKDGKYTDGLDYMDENAEKLAKRVHKSEVNLKNMAVSDFQKLNRILESCPLCHHDDSTSATTQTSSSHRPLAPVVALATRTFLTLPTLPEVTPGGAVIVPSTHRTNLLECDDDEWEELRNFMKALTRMYHEQGRDVVFYENAAAPGRRLHAALVAAPIPYQEGATAPAYFKEAFLSADEEWSQHPKIIDTLAKANSGMGRSAFRRSLAKEMPYFHVWFSLDGGLGHVVENSDRWPRGDLFAREVVGGIVGAEPHVVKKQGRWRGGEGGRVEEWKRGWRKFDWTRALAEEGGSG